MEASSSRQEAIAGHGRHQVPLSMMGHGEGKGNMSNHFSQVMRCLTWSVHWRYASQGELQRDKATFLQGKGVKEELNLTLKSTWTVYTKTTLDSSCGLRLIQMTFRHLSFVQ